MSCETEEKLPQEETEEEPEPYPPWNFAWVVAEELATMAWPQNVLNLDYLHEVGIRHLVTLSPEKMPPMEGYDKIEWTLIPVDEFEDPSIDQIAKFLEICRDSLSKKQPLGVHCRMGHGRSGVMAACYLVKFKDMTPESAIAEVRLTRSNAIETLEQEKVIFQFYNSLKGMVATVQSGDQVIESPSSDQPPPQPQQQ